jgi:hypothetical protein
MDQGRSGVLEAEDGRCDEEADNAVADAALSDLAFSPLVAMRSRGIYFAVLS